MATAQDVVRHYASGDIAERLLAALRAANGPDAPITPESLAPLDQFHSRGLDVTREVADALSLEPGHRVLDIGCGIGGPARWIAAAYGCHVTGIDLTPEFCEAAEALNAATGLSDRVRIVHGSALALPFEGGSFDRAYSQNVVMNIADKVGFYREAGRVLRNGGLLALSNVALGPAGEPYYPAPWAESEATSFLSTPEQTRDEIAAAGLEIVWVKDTTPDQLAFYEQQRRRIAAEGPPKLGVHILVGERMKEYQRNTARGVQEGRLVAIEALCRKPG